MGQKGCEIPKKKRKYKQKKVSTDRAASNLAVELEHWCLKVCQGAQGWKTF